MFSFFFLSKVFHVQLVGHAWLVERHLSRPLAFQRLGMAIHCEEERGAHVGPSGHGLL
jgi:hypothetical protein